MSMNNETPAALEAILFACGGPVLHERLCDILGVTPEGLREAAAFLRRCGADVTRVRKLFRDDVVSYRTKADAVSHAQIFMDALPLTFADDIEKARYYVRACASVSHDMAAVEQACSSAS